MARQESDREDMMCEATGLPRRVSFAGAQSTEPIVAGFRSTGGMSLYFGADPVYQFDAAGGLRRAYDGGYLYRTQGATLARLQRQRLHAEVTLTRYDLSAGELKDFLARIHEHLAAFHDELTAQKTRVVARVPVDDPVEDAVLEFVGRLLGREGGPVLAPPIRGKW